MCLRILVADDSAVFRRVIVNALDGLPGIEVVACCPNGRIALQRIVADRPDLVTLDMEMPEMNGLEVLEAMRRQGIECCVIVLSALGDRARELTVRALELGAFDFLTKPQCPTPEENLAQLRERLAPLVAAAGHRAQVRSLLRGGRAAPPPPAPPKNFRPPARAGAVDDSATRACLVAGHGRPAMVLIGVSTGGPVALARLIPELPAALGVPVIVVQHMPPLFTRNLAESLDSRSALRIKEAEDGELARAGCVYLAPGGSHLKVSAATQGEIVLRITGDPPENNCRPAVDYLFRSAAAAFPGRALAVILTGMGSDGTLGLRRLKAGGCLSIAQDEASCVVFGMPKEAIQAGLVDLVLPLGSISAEIVKAVR